MKHWVVTFGVLALHLSSTEALLGNLLGAVGSTVGSTVGAVGSTVNGVVKTVTGTGSATADPIVSSFDGRTFEFFGKVGRFYNVIQDAEHQVSMRLKLGTVSDHEGGTYIDGVGFGYQSHRVVIQLLSDDSVEVTLDGERLHFGENENSQAHELTTAAGKLRLLWQLFRPKLGNTIELTTDLLRLTVYRTDAGSLDKNGEPQPTFLNFDAQLLHPPAHEMQARSSAELWGRISRLPAIHSSIELVHQFEACWSLEVQKNKSDGIVGEGYTRVLGAEKLPDDGVFYPAPGASIDSYEMPGYFHAHATGAGLRFGGAAYSHQRILVLNDRLGASVADIAAGLDAAALPVAHAGGGSRRLLR
ncbi:hypothetical protein COCSUDRAFT_43159 [Coccomyxa subellipsoidea C-169]|uniref:Uncharacterized protein n=1 Tax=Coccomyxa subellipsoidea (strain C-169) TaxID=574566 RepID=I0YSQ4_COCSC|nr:hypothetical protein COCSUDRAFT_43159 [Coccomyxa subellipsoidea C-169]EIE21423.1 hypothetical protein COCSUDRAFT_43159 [Coccomyxa subellipsoidea C-169]|eukprot:XP_005645967.1 hypothetical protein COCSUDRAFT_43159 [Coccomyxa subellipsoidea C-169]